MKRKMKITLSVVLVLLVAIIAIAYIAYREFVGFKTFDEEFYAADNNQNSKFSYDSYANVLRKHVDTDAMVSYATLKENPTELDRFVRALATVDPKTYEQWDKKAKIAFWINAYNALTLKVIINNYPIEKGIFSGMAYSPNSIRQISGVWDKVQFLVMGQRMTLNQIEHDLLRREDEHLTEKYGQFNEPCIHVALVCAAKGCPSLRNEPFVGDKLDEQLNDQTKRFLSNPSKFRIDQDNAKVYLSSIFQWFGKDFVETYAPKEGFGNHSEVQRAVLNFISKHLISQQSDFLRSGKYTIEYLDYDWSLNEQ